MEKSSLSLNIDILTTKAFEYSILYGSELFKLYILVHWILFYQTYCTLRRISTIYVINVIERHLMFQLRSRPRDGSDVACRHITAAAQTTNQAAPLMLKNSVLNGREDLAGVRQVRGWGGIGPDLCSSGTGNEDRTPVAVLPAPYLTSASDLAPCSQHHIPDLSI